MHQQLLVRARFARRSPLAARRSPRCTDLGGFGGFLGGVRGTSGSSASATVFSAGAGAGSTALGNTDSTNRIAADTSVSSSILITPFAISFNTDVTKSFTSEAFMDLNAATAAAAFSSSSSWVREMPGAILDVNSA
jgi:hypothetical protein